MNLRKIIHIDMDAFYASVEQRDNPALRGRPIAVGHAGERGVVATASYEARRFGVRSAISSQRAAKLCPELVFVEPRFDVYKEVSAQMHEIFHEYTDLVEPISLDEAFLDVTVNKPNIPLAITIAREIKEKIRMRLNLTASAGISYNKFLAKIASDQRKPDGVCTIHPSQALEFIAALKVEKFWGVGPATAAKMHTYGLFTGLDIRQADPQFLERRFGKMGAVYQAFSNGIDHREVQPTRVRKSVGCEETFHYDLQLPSPDFPSALSTELEEALHSLAAYLLRRLQRANFQGTTLTLKAKYTDFTIQSRSQPAPPAPYTESALVEGARQLLPRLTASLPVRLLGLSISNPTTPEEPLPADLPRQLIIDFDTEY